MPVHGHCKTSAATEAPHAAACHTRHEPVQPADNFGALLRPQRPVPRAGEASAERSSASTELPGFPQGSIEQDSDVAADPGYKCEAGGASASVNVGIPCPPKKGKKRRRRLLIRIPKIKTPPKVEPIAPLGDPCKRAHGSVRLAPRGPEILLAEGQPSIAFYQPEQGQHNPTTCRDVRGNHMPYTKQEDEWASCIWGTRAMDQDQPLGQFFRGYMMYALEKYKVVFVEFPSGMVDELKRILGEADTGQDLLENFLFADGKWKTWSDGVLTSLSCQGRGGFLFEPQTSSKLNTPQTYESLIRQLPFFEPGTGPERGRITLYERRPSYEDTAFGISESSQSVIPVFFSKPTRHMKGQVRIKTGTCMDLLRAETGCPLVGGASGTLLTHMVYLAGWGYYTVRPKPGDDFADGCPAAFPAALSHPFCAETILASLFSVFIGLGHHTYAECMLVAQAGGYFKHITDVRTNYQRSFTEFRHAFSSQRLAERAELCRKDTPEKSLRVLTFNIHNGYYGRVKDVSQTAPGMEEDRNYEEVIHLAAHRKPDAFAMQEVAFAHSGAAASGPAYITKEQLETSLGAMGYKVFVCEALKDTLWNVLAVKGEFDPRNPKIFTVKHPLEGEPPRGHPEARCGVGVTLTKRGVDIFVATTHISPFENEMFSDFTELSKFMGANSPGGMSAVVMGDFNTEREMWTFSGGGRGFECLQSAMPTGSNSGRSIDLIFFKKDAALVPLHEALPIEYTKTLSDHLAVEQTFEIRSDPMEREQADQEVPIDFPLCDCSPNAGASDADLPPVSGSELEILSAAVSTAIDEAIARAAQNAGGALQ